MEWKCSDGWGVVQEMNEFMGSCERRHLKMKWVEVVWDGLVMCNVDWDGRCENDERKAKRGVGWFCDVMNYDDLLNGEAMCCST